METTIKEPIVRWEGGTARDDFDVLVEEEPLEIRVRGRAISVTMRTPGHDEELAVGFLLSEGLIRVRQDILRIEPCGRNEFGNLINVQLAPDVAIDFSQLTRHVFASSSCGLCGKATIDSIRNRFAPIGTESVFTVPAALLTRMAEEMRKGQSTFDRTGGLHAAAIFSPEGELVVLREDVGRHNAVDKVLGYALLKGLTPLERSVLLVSGRSSFEIVQKALAGRIPFIAAVSAPSNLAVQFATANNQTLVGFLRPNRMNIYAGVQRMVFT